MLKFAQWNEFFGVIYLQNNNDRNMKQKTQKWTIEGWIDFFEANMKKAYKLKIFTVP